MMSLILSKLWGLVAAAAAFLGLFLGYKWEKRRRKRAEARADGLEAELKVRRETERINGETRKAEEKLERLAEGDGLADYFRDGRLLRGDSEGGDT